MQFPDGLEDSPFRIRDLEFVKLYGEDLMPYTYARDFFLA